MDSPLAHRGLNPGRGVSKRRKIDKVTVNDTRKKPVPCMKNKRVVNMSGVKKDQGGVEEETSTSKRTGASHLRVGLATDLKRC